MTTLNALEAGVMMWAGRDSIAEMKAMGARCGQLGVGGDYPLHGAAAAWKADLEREQFTLVTVFCAYNGEDYADIPTVERTVGFVPLTTRAEREARTLAVADFGAAIGVKSVACHAGFVPEDKTNPIYAEVLELVRRVCDHCAKNGQSFVLETGQEPAAVLLDFFKDVNRPNLGINFDPANMILYGMGEPIPALKQVGAFVRSVHCKDATWSDQPGVTWGAEVPLGKGQVDMRAFLMTLKEIGYYGPLTIEREIPQDRERQKSEIQYATELLSQLRSELL